MAATVHAATARFSFLLGLPTLAGGKELWELYKVHLDAHGWSVLAVGPATGSVAAFFAIWGLLRILKQFSSWPFVIYRGPDWFAAARRCRSRKAVGNESGCGLAASAMRTDTRYRQSLLAEVSPRASGRFDSY